ncbi:MAG: alpha/beta fold hydrolase [Acetobacteraceae bacterium]|nr:alpha/beta fold hydrolase [Acetobacteraceae bacterium]
MLLDMQKHARMAQRPAIAGDGAVIDVESLRGESGAVRHLGPRSGGLRGGMIAMPRMRSTMLPALLTMSLLFGGCTTRLAPPGAPVMAPAETPDAFVMPDGMRLPYRAWLPEGAPQAVVLALHGMNDSRDAWEIPGPEFAVAGVAVFSPDQRGFGATSTRGYWAGTKGMTDDARTMAGLLRRRYPGTPLYLMGESMGAAVLMVLATGPSPPDVDGYVLSAPAVWGRAKMNIFLRGLLWTASRTVPGFVLVNRGYVKVTASDNREALVRLSTDPLTIHGTRVDTVRGLVDLMDAALASAALFRGRALFLYGGKDELIPKRATVTTWRALPPGEARRAYYAERYHLAMRDLGRATVIADVVAWMKDPGSALVSGADRAAEDWVKTVE